MKRVLVLFAFLLSTCWGFAQVGINTTTIGDGAVLDISSTDKGVLFPRVSLTSTIIDDPVEDPAMGVMVFNINTAGSGNTAVSPGLYFWDDVKNEWNRVTSGEQGNHYVGELYGGGIVFYIYENGEHGLIASLDDLGSSGGVDWGPRSNVSTAESWWDGATNTTDVVAAGPAATDAVKLCDDYSNDGFTDWHLPSIGELKALEEAAYVLFKVLDSDGDPSTNAPDYTNSYWSSTNQSKDDAYSFKFTNTHTEIKDKDENFLVRAVRSF